MSCEQNFTKSSEKSYTILRSKLCFKKTIIQLVLTYIAKLILFLESFIRLLIEKFDKKKGCCPFVLSFEFIFLLGNRLLIL
jgi:hypothetical protein